VDRSGPTTTIVTSRMRSVAAAAALSETSGSRLS
jgi:hypothetical protein